MDWDDTLCPDTISGLIQKLGYHPEAYWEPLDALVKQGWDITTAYMKGMVDTFKDQNALGIFRDYAQQHMGYPEAHSLIARLKATLPESIQLHTIILSSGLRTLIEAAPVSEQFDHIFASDFAFDQEGRLIFPKTVLNKGDKARVLQDLTLGRLKASSWPSLKTDVPAIPAQNMLFLGDGYTDIPCFEWMNDHGGHALAVYPEDRIGGRQRAQTFHEKGWVSGFATADYRNDSPLMQQIQQHFTLCLKASENLT
jgi:hypothetical protein